MTPIEGIDYFVSVVPFPNFSADGLVRLESDGTYSILLNANLPLDRQKDVLTHELNHIKNGDFYRDDPIEQIEKDAG